jgi:DNA helicase-2/ATP-dependent DNA helicase PcrA
VWPAPVDRVARRWREDAATAVLAELSAPSLLHVDPTLSPADRDRVARWDHDLPLLIAEARAAVSQERSVRLPGALSASALINLAEDPDRFALDLVRPMPRPPAPAARRGTAFHAWVESRYGQQPLLLPEDLPGAADDDIGSDDELRRLQEAFERSPFADRTPAGVEAPFAIVLADRVIRGRIDAVFDDGPRIELIDWKTGGRAGLHALQLAIYRVAWAEQHGLPLDRIDAAFYLVGTGELIRPTDLPDRPTLEAIIRAEVDYRGGLE